MTSVPRTVLAITAAATMCGVASAQATHYHYFKTPVELPLDGDRVAVLAAVGTSADQIRDALALDPTIGVEAWPVVGWSLVDVPGGASPLELAAAPRNARSAARFVTPVFVDLLGGPMFPTPDVLVGFPESVDAKAILDAVAPGTRRVDEGNGIWRIVDAAADGLAVIDLANQLAVRDDVVFAEPDMVFTGTGDGLPDDEFINSCWGLHNTGQDIFEGWHGLPDIPNNGTGVVDFDIDAPEAWDISTGDPSIRVAIIDTGVQLSHPDLNVAPGTDVTNNPGSNGNPANQCDNHGTPAAGVVSAIANNAIGVSGVAPECVSVPIRTFIALTPVCNGSWTSASSWTATAVNWAVSNDISITNNSNSYGFQSGAIAVAYANARTAGLVHFGSAGNGALPQMNYPASLPSIQAVNATLHFDGSLAPFSNYGPGLAYTGPGSWILTTDRTGHAGWTQDYGDPFDDYIWISGSSFACPMAAGIAALARSVDPSLTPQEIEDLISETAVDLGDPGYDEMFGAGQINAFGVLSAIDTGDPADLNGDGVVDGADLGIMLGSWGACPGCPADLNGDDVVDGADLGLLLGAWTI